MKIENVKEATVTTNLGTSDVTDMSIDLSGIPHLMNILTNLYNNPTLAVVREYFTNALDAQTRLGNTSPVKVTLPSWDSPVYVVQDCGIGMTPKDIRNTYARYGASTKRESNDEIGAFGLGCKSALTISNQFTVISIKDGYKTSVLISKSETGINTVNIISILPTEEPSGTTVKIPVPSVSKFNQEASQFFRYTTPSRVLIDGKHPENHFEDLKLIPSDNTGAETYVQMSKRYWGSTSIVVTMGEVPYSVEGRDLESVIGHRDTDLFNKYPVFVKAPIGSVDLTPNREGLRMTDKTTDFIKSCYASLRKMMQEMAQQEVDAVENRGDIGRALKPWDEFASNVTWKGEDYLEDVASDITLSAIYKNTLSRSTSSKDLVDSIPTQSRSVVFIDLGTDDIPRVSRSLTTYVRHMGADFCSFYFAKGSSVLKSPWITENHNITSLTEEEFVEACKARRKIDRATRVTGSKKEPSKIQYPVIDTKAKSITLMDYDKIPDGTPYLSTETIGTENMREVSVNIFNSVSTDWDSEIAKDIATLTESPQVVVVTGSRTSSALKTRVKGTFDIVDEIKKKVDDFEMLRKDTEIIRQYTLKSNSQLGRFIDQGLEKKGVIERIKDLDLSEALKARVLDDPPELRKAHRLRRALLRYTPRTSGYVQDIPKSGDLSYITKRYPLLRSLRYNEEKYTEHALKYINEIYTTEVAVSNDS